jgi:hypothetical protein
MIATFSPAAFGLGHLACGEDVRTCGLFGEAGGKRR